MNLREPSHILILLIVVVVLFGAKRLPDSARALGRSLRIFKAEVKDLDSSKGESPKVDEQDKKSPTTPTE